MPGTMIAGFSTTMIEPELLSSMLEFISPSSLSLSRLESSSKLEFLASAHSRSSF